MPISRSDELFALVKSLTPSEKRHFKIFTQRQSDGEELMYLQLFDILDKQKAYDDRKINKTVPKQKLPNLKRHLYKQILTSLRVLQKKRQLAIQVRELIDYAHILYGKGLYKQSLRLLAKADKMAIKIADDLLRLQILEFIKVIESRHITRTGTTKVVPLAAETRLLLKRVEANLLLSNLRLETHGWYITKGHVRSDAEADDLRQYWAEIHPDFQLDALNKVDKSYYYQARVWYHFTLYEWEDVLHYAHLWVDLFNGDLSEVHRDTNVLMRGYHYLLTAYFNLGKTKAYNEVLLELENYRKENYGRFNKNTQVISFLYVHNGRLNKYILAQQYEQGLRVVPRTLARIKRYRPLLDDHRILVFYFKIAILYLMAGQPDEAITYLRRITHTELVNLREDLQVYARLAFLMAHYDAGNIELMPYLVQEVKAGLRNLSQESVLQVELPRFFSKMAAVPLTQRKATVKDFHKRMQRLSEDVYEKRAFLYLDILTWLQRKI